MMHVKIYLLCLFIGFLITIAIGYFIDKNNSNNDQRL